MKTITRTLSLCAGMLLLTASFAAAADRNAQHTSNMFVGPKANTGTVMHLYENGKSILRVSQDFKVPDTPAPTWRVVDSSGTVYTLDAFKIKGGEKRAVTVPTYVKDIAKVQVYCAWPKSCSAKAAFLPPFSKNPSLRGGCRE